MKLKAGDLFTIPVDQERMGFGQIIYVPNKDNFMMVVFKNVYRGKEWPGLSEIVEDDILLLGYSLHAKLYHKHWKIIGNITSNLPKIKMPYYKLGNPPDCKLVDFKGNIVGKISKEVFSKLEYQSVMAPVGYELALQSHHNIGELSNEYNEILYSNILKSILEVEKK